LKKIKKKEKVRNNSREKNEEIKKSKVEK